MGKRSNFARIPQDLYLTPHKAVLPLLPHLTPGQIYSEPCAADGNLVRHLERHGFFCEWAGDALPQRSWINWADARTIKVRARMFITNPPWGRKLLHPIIINLSDQAPTWLLLDTDWMHTKQAGSFMAERCRKVVSIGRVRWIPDSKQDGVDNSAWFLFDAPGDYQTQFVGRL